MEKEKEIRQGKAKETCLEESKKDVNTGRARDD